MPGTRRNTYGLFYRTWRKIRFLRHRGTLLHKNPLSVRLKEKRKRRRELRRRFLFLRFRLFYRYHRLKNYRIDKSIRQAKFLAGNKIPVKNNTREKKRDGAGFSKYLRLLRYKSRKRRHAREYRKAEAAKRFSRSQIIYRKVRYLYNTGQLFYIDKQKLARSFDERIGFISRKKYLTISVNSTFLYLTAAVFVYLVKQFVVALTANSFDIQTVIFYYDIDYLIRGTEWTPDAVKVVFSIGPLTTFILSILSLVLYLAFLDKDSIGRTFILWIFCHSLINFLGEIMAGTLMTKGFGWVMMYLFVMDTGKMLISLFSFILLIASGLFLSNVFLYTGNTYFRNLKGRAKNKFIFSQITLPFLLGNIILLILKSPKVTEIEIFINLSMILLLLPAIIRGRFINDLYFEDEEKKIHLCYWWILSAAIVLIIFRTIFAAGVKI